MTRPRKSLIGKITRSRKRSNGTGMSAPPDQQSRRPHVLDRHSFLAEMLFERETLRRRIAEAERHLRRRIDAAVGEIAARAGAGARGEYRLEEFRSDLDHV